MSLPKSNRRVVRRAVRRSIPLGIVLVVLIYCLAGCGDRVRLPSTAQVIEFENAGPIGPAVDLNRLIQAKLETGPYRVVPGDVLQLEMPRILDPQMLEATGATGGKEAYRCHVNDAGTIVLPVVGRLSVAGKSLVEIESAIIAEYCPKYIKTQPPVYASMLEYRTLRVSIMGAVARPGIYALRHDQISLVALLMEAGGIAEEGAAVIRIARPDQAHAYPSGTQASITSQTAGAWKTRTAMSEQVVPAVHSPFARGQSMARAVFQREGPLNTTGSLVLEDADDVLAERWLDLGSEHQREGFLQTAAARSTSLPTVDLERRLWQLARFLESRAGGQDVPSASPGSGWETTSDGRFVASFPGAVPDRIRLSGAIETGPTKKLGRDAVATLVLPVRGLNIPFADVALQEGDSVIVEPPQEQYISVLGLVSRPDNFPYPPDARYTLIQALAFAGGMDLTADPRYVSVYRLRADGTVASVTYQLVDPKKQEQLTEAMRLPLRPGDVVSVEHTPRTRTNVFFDKVFRITLGLYFSPDTFWDRR